jgi:diguanylate cyclase (GGDEF)-like protein
MKILIADDQPAQAGLLEELVRPWGYEAVTALDGAEALEALQGPDAPRLALLDWLMPGLDGIEVCRRVRQGATEPYPYLVLMTGLGGRDQMIEGLEAGADDFLAKPIDATELRARLGAGRRIVHLQDRLLESQRRFREQAMRDGLTGLLNRAAVLAALERELARGQREGRPVGVLLADVDHFKGVNDTLGHQAGDEVLRQVAARLASALRPYDAVGRYGGEEFLIVLPGCDGPALADLAERVRQRVAAAPVTWEGEAVAVTLSVGAAARAAADDADPAALLRAADEALYRAKRAGRNRVSLAAEPACSA